MQTAFPAKSRFSTIQKQKRGTGVVIDSESHLIRTFKTRLLFAPLAVRVQTDCSAFPFYTATKSFKRIHITLFCFLNYN